MQALAWHQIIGGAIGLKKVFDELWNGGYHSTGSIFLCLIALGLYTFTLYAGRLLLSDRYENGLALTFINQCFQVISITVFGCTFMYYSGVIFKLYGYYWHEGGSYSKSAGFDFKYLSDYRFAFGSGSSELALGINFVGLYLTYFSYRLYKQVRMERQYIESRYAVTS